MYIYLYRTSLLADAPERLVDYGSNNLVDHRRTLGESGRGYPCYILKPPKIALVAVSGTRSSAAVNGFSGARLSMGFQVHGRRRVFRCTVIDEFSGAVSSLPRL